METERQRVVLITGASSGIGKACAQVLRQRGYRVYGTSRHAAQPPVPPGAGGEPSESFQLIPMDVTSDESVKKAIELVMTSEGRLDVVVNNAGCGFAGAVEDTSMDEAREQMETNFFGVVRVCRAVLPIMRQQGGGYLINISSIGGLIGIPFQSMYSASKFAIEGFSEALRMEVKPYGIKVALIEPGDFCTGFTANRRKTGAAQGETVYAERFGKALGVMETDETHGPAPEQVGHLLARLITTGSPKPRYMVGPAFQKLAAGLKKVLPPRLFEWAFMKYYQLL